MKITLINGNKLILDLYHIYAIEHIFLGLGGVQVTDKNGIQKTWYMSDEEAGKLMAQFEKYTTFEVEGE